MLAKILVFGWLAVVSGSRTATAKMSGDRRVIFTSGQKVHTIRYLLGQSTVLFLNAKPETIICGNRNYFNIEKLKFGVTVQPLSNFSTNLTILSGSNRYLFYLTPSQKRDSADTFVDVKYVPPEEVKEAPLTSFIKDVRLVDTLYANDVEIHLSRLSKRTSAAPSILDFQIYKSSRTKIHSRSIGIVAFVGGEAVANQIMVLERDMFDSGKAARGRLILPSGQTANIELVLTVNGSSKRILLHLPK